jgi:hypothetical protein
MRHKTSGFVGKYRNYLSVSEAAWILERHQSEVVERLPWVLAGGQPWITTWALGRIERRLNEHD